MYVQCLKSFDKKKKWVLTCVTYVIYNQAHGLTIKIRPISMPYKGLANK